MQDQVQPDDGPKDDILLETFFGQMCRTIAPLPGETFPDLAARWMEALAFAKALDPRDPREWMSALEVTAWHFTAAHTVYMAQQPNLTIKERADYAKLEALNAKALMQTYRRYEKARRAR